jgi:4-diphosphocytidyl-2-C-methyl-D-erythritol kinase
LENSPAVCRGRGEQSEPIAGLGTLHFAVVRPPEGLSTAAVYRACRSATEPRGVGPLVAALRCGDLAAIGRLLFNRLESAAARLSPWIDRLRRVFAGMDVVGHGMSGSGTSYFGLCRHARHALRVARQLQAGGAGSVFAVQSCG